METQQSQAKEATTAKKRRHTPRPYRYFVQVRHRQIDAETQKPAEPEFLEFTDKKALREGLGIAKYEGAELRIVRGYEMAVKARRSISLN